jgi:DNA primase
MTREEIQNKQFLIDLYVYGNLSFDEIREIGKKFFSIEEVEEVLDYLFNLEKSYQEWLKEQKKVEDKNEIQVMIELFPDLIKHPEEILESLKENLKNFIKTKDELDFLMIKNAKLLAEEKEKLSTVYLEIKERYLKCVERIDALSSLIEFLETHKKIPEKTDFTEEKENFRDKVKKVLCLDIERVIENEFGDKIPHGEPAMIRCQLPGHNDREPSFAVYKRTNSFYCFGCQRGGNVINFIKHLFDFNFIEAVNYLYKKYV